MVTFIERDGVRYQKTTVEIRDDLHKIAKMNNWNITALLNKALEEKVKSVYVGKKLIGEKNETN